MDSRRRRSDPSGSLKLSARRKRNRGENLKAYYRRKTAMNALVEECIDETENESQIPSCTTEPNIGVKKEDCSKSEEISVIEERFKCCVCSLFCNSNFELKLHSLIHSQTDDSNNCVSRNSEGMFKCDMCEKSFKLLKHLKIHKIVHLCELKKSVQIPGSIKKQPRKSMRLAETKPDSKCESQTAKRKSKNIYPCSLCNKSFDCCDKMRKHEVEHTDQFADVRRCLSKVVKISSVDTKSIAFPSKFKCPNCDLEFDSAVTLEVHFVEVHLNLKLFICSACNLTFTEKESYEKHVETHTSDMERGRSGFECDKCKKKFKFSRNFNSHQKLCPINYGAEQIDVNAGYDGRKIKKQYKVKRKKKSHSCCYLCVDNFSSFKELKHHIFEKHGSEKDFDKILNPKFKQKPLKLTHKKKKPRKNSKGRSGKCKTKLINKNKCKKKSTEVIQETQDSSTGNPCVVHLNQTQQVKPELLYNLQPTFSALNTTTTPDIQNITLSNGPAMLNPVPVLAVPVFNFDSEEYISWLKSFINKCKDYECPLPLTLAKTIIKVSDDLFDALIMPEGSMKRKENHFYLLKFYQIVSNIMLRHAKHCLRLD